MAHYFKILKNEKTRVYQAFEDIPKSFENVIAFKPEIPPPPHTEEQHNEIDSWGEKLKDLMKRETK